MVGDAGIYYYEETLLFPSEHKGSNQLIIKNIEEGSNESETYDTNGDPVYKIKKSKEAYQWTGKKFNIL